MYDIIPTTFKSHECSMDARLYVPGTGVKTPVVIMAHGFGARMDFGLHPFAHAFASIGYAVLMFDYRGFGKSEGSPRQLIFHTRHIEDYRAAIEYVKGLPNIDSSNIILWGTSYSGGHALTAASYDKTIAGVIAHVPFVDGIATALNLPIKNIISGLYAGLKDVIASSVTMKPYTIPIAAPPDTYAALNTLESYQGYLKLVPPEARDENWCPARVCLTLPWYRPVMHVHHISCAVCVIAALYDSLIPIAAVKKTAKKIKNVRYHELPCGHFDPYFGDDFEESIAIQKKFLESVR